MYQKRGKDQIVTLSPRRNAIKNKLNIRNRKFKPPSRTTISKEIGKAAPPKAIKLDRQKNRP